jgi:hypothetical protein
MRGGGVMRILFVLIVLLIFVGIALSIVAGAVSQ